MPLPKLAGDGFVLLPATNADASALQRHWNRRAIRRHLWDGQPVLSSHVDAVLDAQALDLQTRGVGLFTIRPRDAPDRIIGCVGLRSLPGPADDSAPRTELPPELVVSVDHSRWRQGIATQAVRLVLHDAHHRAGLDEVLAVVAAGNTTAARGLARLGFQPQPAIVVLGAPMPTWRKSLP